MPWTTREGRRLEDMRCRFGSAASEPRQPSPPAAANKRPPPSVASGWTNADGARRALRRELLEVLVEPVDVAPEPVLNVAGLGEPVELARVDDQLRIPSQAAQRLVHLLAVEQRDIEILLAAQEQ